MALNWTEIHDQMTDEVTRLVARTKVGQVTITFVWKGDAPAFDYRARIGERSLGDVVDDLESAKHGAEVALALLATARAAKAKLRASRDAK
jgi:hypothetical protein